MILTIVSSMIRLVGLLLQRGIINTGICLFAKPILVSYHLTSQLYCIGTLAPIQHAQMHILKATVGKIEKRVDLA